MRKFAIGFMAAALLAWASPALLASHWTTVQGDPIDPQHNPHKRAAVMFFVTVDCPSSNGYSPYFNAMVKKYSRQNVAFYVIHEDDGVSRREVRKHDSEYGFTCPVVLDPDHSMARHYKIEVTPEVAILGPGAQELYRGRIDDRYVSCGSAANQTSHDLLDALTEVLAGRPVAHPVVPGAGCSIYFRP